MMAFRKEGVGLDDVAAHEKWQAIVLDILIMI